MTVHRSARVGFILAAVATFIVPAGASSFIKLIGGDPVIVPGATKPGVYFSPNPVHQLAFQNLPVETTVQIGASDEGTIVLARSSPRITGLNIASVNLTSSISCPEGKWSTCPLKINGVFTTPGTFSGDLVVMPVNAQATSDPLVYTVVSPIEATSSVTFSPQPEGSHSLEAKSVTVTNVTTQDLVVMYGFLGDSAFTNDSGFKSGELLVPAGSSVTVSVSFDRVGDAAVGTHTASLNFAINGGVVASTSLSGAIVKPLCSVASLLGKSLAGSIHAQINGPQPTRVVGLFDLTVTDAGDVTVEAVLDSPTATASTPDPVPGTIVVNADCSFTLDAPFGIQGFLAQDGTFAAGVFASDGTPPLLSAFRNQPVSGSLELHEVIMANLSTLLFNAHAHDLSRYYGVDSQPGEFQTQQNIGSTPATLVYAANLGGFQSSSTGVAEMSSFNSAGFASGFQTGPGAQSLAMIALQITSAGEVRVIANEPGSSDGALVDESLNPIASAPASGRYVFTFVGASSNPSSNQATVAEFEGTIAYTTPYQGSMTGTWRSFDPRTQTVSVTPMTAPIQASSLRGNFYLDASGAPTLPYPYFCQTNADATVSCINQGQTNPSLPPVPYVTSVSGRPQAQGPYTLSSAVGTYIVYDHPSPCFCTGRLHADQITLAPDGSVTGQTLRVFGPLDVRVSDVAGTWTLDSTTAALTVIVNAPGVETLTYNGFFNAKGGTELIGVEAAADLAMASTFRPSKSK